MVWLDDGRRILLLTGYDGSALEYIGNFTDIAGMYINAAYGNVENYPACKWMLGEAPRASMAAQHGLGNICSTRRCSTAPIRRRRC